MFKKKVHECPLTDNFIDLRRDVGFESRYGLMSKGYIPLVERVQYLEAVIETLLDHFNLEANYKVAVMAIRDKEPK